MSPPTFFDPSPSCGYPDSGSDKCYCCDELVGFDDAETIREQIRTGEKNCMWCGDDFDLGDEDREYLLEDTNGIKTMVLGLDENGPYRHAITRDGQHVDIETDSVWSQAQTKQQPIDDADFERERKRAIQVYYGVDISRETFDPGYADAHGNPRDRINDALPYEQIRVNSVAFKILKFISTHPNCTAVNIKRGVRLGRKELFKRLPDSPTSRLFTTGLIDCTSKFIGFVDMSATATTHPSGYFGKMPRFSRRYTISIRGDNVINEFETGRKMVLL